MNLNIKKHLYNSQYKTILKSIYLLIIEYKETLYYYILSIKKKIYKLKKKIYINREASKERLYLITPE